MSGFAIYTGGHLRYFSMSDRIKFGMSRVPIPVFYICWRRGSFRLFGSLFRSTRTFWFCLRLRFRCLRLGGRRSIRVLGLSVGTKVGVLFYAAILPLAVL